MEIIALLALALVAGVTLDAVLGRSASEFLPFVGQAPLAGTPQRLTLAEALYGPGALFLLAAGLALLPGNLILGGALAGCGLALGWRGLLRSGRGR